MQRVGENGKFYLSFGNYDLVFDAHSIIEISSGNKEEAFFKEIKKELQNSFSNFSHSTTLKVAAFIDNFQYEQWFSILPKLSEFGGANLELMLPHPKEKNFFGYEIDKKNMSITEENLTKFLKYFMPKITRLKITFTENIDALKLDIQYKKYSPNLILIAGIGSSEIQKWQEDLQWLRSNCHKSVQVYAMQLVKLDKNEKEEKRLDLMWSWDAKGNVSFFSEEQKKENYRSASLIMSSRDQKEYSQGRSIIGRIGRSISMENIQFFKETKNLTVQLADVASKDMLEIVIKN